MQVTVLHERSDIRAACSLFAERVASEWSIGAAEPRGWIERDLEHPEALAFGLVSEQQLIGVATVAPLEHVLSAVTPQHATQVRHALRARGIDDAACWHWGGHALAASVTGQGLSQLLLEAVARHAISRDARTLLAQTQPGSSGHALALRHHFTECARYADYPSTVVWLMRALTTGH